MSTVKPKRKKKSIAGNLIKQTQTYWELSYACRCPINTTAGITFEQATKKIRGALLKLGPHRKVVKRLEVLQNQLIFGATSCKKGKKKTSSRSTAITYMSEHRILKTPTNPSL